jgi:hypothetical protein
MKLTIEYDSSSGYPGFDVYDCNNRYLGHIEYIENDNVMFHFACCIMPIGEQALLMVALLKQIGEKPLTRENYPKCYT